MNYFLKKQTTGFTIIETMIATSLFLVVMVLGVGSLLSANSVSHRSDSERAVLDNLSFVLEEMSRNLRTGFNYHCEEGSSTLGDLSLPNSCDLGYLIAFEDTNGDIDNAQDQWVYKIEGGVSGLTISKSIDSGDSWIDLIDSSVVSIDNSSGFSVLGALPPPDTQQPLVIIRLAGEIKGKYGTTPFSLQTAVSQRLLDI